MEKISSRTISQIKNLYKANEADLNKVAKLDEKIAALTAEKEEIMEGVNMVEARVKAITLKYSGKEYTSPDLIEVVYTPVFNADGTPKLDEKGYQMKNKKYVAKYGDAFFPIEEIVETSVEKANADAVDVFNEIEESIPVIEENEFNL